MHKKNSLHRNTSSMRIARAAQVRLDEISDKIERDKHKSIKSNYHEKVKIWNELKSIHRVFEPLYVIKENQARLARNQPDLSKLDSKNRAHESDGMRKDRTVSLKYQPRLLQRVETQSNVTKQRRRHTEPKIEALEGWKAKLVNSTSQDTAAGSAQFKWRSQSWSFQGSSKTEAECPRLALPQRTEREHNSKLRSASEEPRISNSMCTIALGYMAFKRVLKNKKLCQGLEPKVVDSRFRSMSMHETELSANSRLVMPEHSEAINEKEDTLKLLFPATEKTVNPHLVKKDNNGRKPNSKRRASTCVNNRRQLISSLSWPLGELPVNPTGVQKSLLSPDHISHAHSPNVSRSRSEMSVRSLPQALKTERVKTGKASGSIEQEHSSESDEEIKFGTFHEYFGEKPMHSWLKKPLKRGSKLLKPVGSGCFSESFQALTHSKT